MIVLRDLAKRVITLGVKAHLIIEIRLYGKD